MWPLGCEFGNGTWGETRDTDSTGVMGFLVRAAFHGGNVWEVLVWGSLISNDISFHHIGRRLRG